MGLAQDADFGCESTCPALEDHAATPFPVPASAGVHVEELGSWAFDTFFGDLLTDPDCRAEP